MNPPWFVLAISVAVGIALISVIYAAAYWLIARFGMGANLRFVRSYVAALVGLPLGLGVAALGGAAAFHQQVQGIGPVLLIAFAGMLVMTCVNVILLRTEEGGRVNFIQAFVMQLVPNVALVAHSIATRPDF